MDPAWLLEHREWLRRLARSLARDRDGSEADDLVQDTFLAALRSPPDPSRPVKPWFAEVLRNVWRMRRRGESRRTARETAVHDPDAAAPSPEQLLERAAALSRLSALLGELPEELRTTVLLRYGEGLSAAAIAELQGLPAGTVRWRLKTAMDRLRAGLDAQEGRDRWRAAFLVPFANPSSHASVLGALTMKKWLVVALAALLIVLGWFTYSRRGTPTAAPTASTTTRAAAENRAASSSAARDPAGAEADLAGAAARQLADPSRAAFATPDPSPTGVIEGRVINWSTGHGVAGAELSFAMGAGTLAVRSDADGRFELAPTAPAMLATASAPGFLPYAPEWGTSPVRVSGRPGQRVSGAIVFLFPALDYHGQVVDPEGKPVAGARVTLFPGVQGEDRIDPLPTAFTSDKDGRFVFHAADGAVLEARARGFGPGRAWLNEQVSINRRMTIRLARAGENATLGARSLAGRVVDERGQPVGGARIRADAAPGRPAEAVPVPPAFAESDGEGRFELAGLDALEYDLEVSEDQHATARQRVVAGKPVHITLTGGGSLSGRVVDVAGAPVVAFTVLVLARDGLRTRLVDSRSMVDAEGRFEFAHLPAGDLLLGVAARGFAPSEPVGVRVEAGKPATVELRAPRGGTVSGTVRDPAGKPVVWARVMLETPGGGATIAPANAGTVSDESGRFRLTGVPPGTVTLTIGAGEHHPRLVSGLNVVDGQELAGLEVVLNPLKEGETPQLELVGIGVKLRPGEVGMFVEGVIEGGGAAAAGLQVGDELISVDGALVAEIGFDAAIARIRGAEGTRVRVGFERAGVRGEVLVERKKLRA